ncbi:hypothetical protein SAMN02990966_03848 [Rhodospirillales bacterium URHD0017]|nr:hypothetical protein SAMN02990966_03848 [Rhodospirillales bacterium URHD0017]
MQGPASNLYLCAVISLAAAVLLLVEATVFPAKAAFFLLAAPTIILALVLVHAAARAAALPFDDAIGRFASGVGLAIRPGGTPSVFAVLLYCAVIMGATGGYAWLALTRTGVTRDDVIVVWGLLDKRQPVFAYLVVVAFVLFHRAMGTLFFAPTYGWQDAVSPRRSWLARVAGAVVVAVVAYCWLGAEALRDVVPAGEATLARFYEYHSLVHLGALEQIRLGATPYIEAQTQYGPGNQLLAYALTKAFGFSNHGFHAGVLLVDVVCIVAFFVIVQQILGLGWALAGLVGWVLWPSPAAVIDPAGWAILTRWIAVPIVALLLARMLLVDGPRAASWLGPVAVGAIWGAGGFMSQENLSGGLLVLIFSLALYGPVCGRSLASLARFAGLFLGGGAMAFAALVAGTIGIDHTLDVLRQASRQSALVMVGVSNSVWSDNVGVTLTLKVVHGWWEDSLSTYGAVRPVLQTYGFAILLMVVVSLLAGYLGRSWRTASGEQRQFVQKFAGVAVGAYVLHLFALLRSDLPHFAGPSYLLPLLLMALPVFAWRCLRPGLGRGLLLLVSVALIAEAAIAGRSELVRHAEAATNSWKKSMAAREIYRALRAAEGQPLDVASRYSPIPRYQAAFRDTPSFAELEELAGLLRDKLQGRPVELVLPTPDDPMSDPELLYFFGGFRSVSGITSPRGSIWTKADRDAWIDTVVRAKNACVFFDSRSLDGPLFRAWNDAARNAVVSNEPIAGKRQYGVLSCK